jgi:uncharacterized protein YrrD
MSLAINEGTGVYTADDTHVGSIDRVVVDPLTLELTHIVVSKGLLLPEDRVLPIGAIATATEQRINLKADVALDDLPLFESTHYVQLTSDELGAAPGPVPFRSLAYFGPYGIPTPAAPTVAPAGTRRNIPNRAVALQAGASVTARSGDVIGRFEELVTTESGLVTHMVIATGALRRSRKAVPIDWIDSVSEEEVRVGVGQRLLDQIPEYDPAAGDAADGLR